MTGNIHFIILFSMQFFIAASAFSGIAFASSSSTSSGLQGLADLLTTGGSDGSPITTTAAEFDPNGTLTAINATLNNYTNPEYGFTFLAPSNWNQTDSGLSRDFTSLHSISMGIPDNTPEVGLIESLFKPEFTVNVYTTEPYLNPDTMTLTNYTVQEYANVDINNLEALQYNSEYQSAQITKNQAQGDAWRVDSILSVSGRQEKFESLVIVQDPSTGYVYKLKFSTPILDVPRDLPIANKVIESFRFMPTG